jgi:hypothetical protein
VKTAKPLARNASFIAIAAAAVLALVASVLSPARPSAGPCAVQSGPVGLTGLGEASGLAVSRRHPGILWSHNDSGNAAVLFAIDATGAVRARIPLPIKTRDWEDISAGRCGDQDCLYVGDIGDNVARRRQRRIYRLPEPALQNTPAPALDTFNVIYPDGAHNAEAMFVIGDDVFIVTRDRTGIVFRATLRPDSRDLSMVRAGEVGLPQVTDAETSTDGQTVIVRTQYQAVLYPARGVMRGDFTPSRRLSLAAFGEPQGEGIALDGSTIYLASEGGVFFSNGALITLRCDLATK